MMSTIAVLLTSSLVTVIAVIGLADAFTHLLCCAGRSIKAAGVVRAATPSAYVTSRERLAA
jgi:hypothetical protein